MSINIEKQNRVKEILSIYVLSKIDDVDKEWVLRHIIFGMEESIDWEIVERLLKTYMPELNKLNWDK